MKWLAKVKSSTNSRNSLCDSSHTYAAHTLLLIIGIIVSLLDLVNFAISPRRSKGTSAFVCVCPFFYLSLYRSLASYLLRTPFHYLISCDIILFLIVRKNKYMHIVSQLNCVLSARGVFERQKNKRKREREKKINWSSFQLNREIKRSTWDCVWLIKNKENIRETKQNR